MITHDQPTIHHSCMIVMDSWFMRVRPPECRMRRVLGG
eukprot:CAMPEP_0115875570 /NCGR_PEP_ID=MMETSP0287-20121206/25166_1 /TAXON_ID=412157 /ORGANISM="Chrysochromulina rotalis, Strain UIO044" /LENGTH=37 /DNA_ID= /DNA_START= /DNA_END= /DNA_ORIENTATION=